MSLNNYPSMHEKGERPSGVGRFLCADMEAIGLLPALRYDDSSCMHTICITDMFSGEEFVFFDPYEKRDPEAREHLENDGHQDGYLQDALSMLMECEAMCFQNAVGYDALAFEIVFPNFWKFNYLEARGKDREHNDYFPVKLMDTMILSQLLNPDRKPPPQAYALSRANVGPHSIEAHGMRIGRYKPENEDWSQLTDHMIHRCSEDTYIGKDFFFWLMNNEWAEHLRRGRNPVSGLGIQSAYRMELQVAIGIARQAQRGFRLDTKQAWLDWVQIGKEMEVVAGGIMPHIPPRIDSEPMKTSHVLKICASYCKAYPNTDCSWLSKHLNRYLALNDDARIGKRAPVWKLTTAKGDYVQGLRKEYPCMVGNANDTKDPLVQGPYSPIVWDEVGLGNLDYIKQNVLYPRGWLGVNFSEADEKIINDTDNNPEGNPPKPWSGKIDEKSLEAWIARDGDIPDWLKGIVSWYVLRSRRSQILNVKDMEYFAKKKKWPNQLGKGNFCKGLLAKAYSKEHKMSGWQYFEKMGEFPMDDQEEWRVPAEAFSIGTNTFRMRHKFVVNIPSRGLRPLRHLFIAGVGKSILGCDGAGLELRMLAHFMNDLTYTSIVLDGDIHTHNQTLAGLPIRDMAKTFIYAFLYGSGIPNLAKVCGLSEEEMKKRVAMFKKELPALARLIDNCGAAAEQAGYLQAIDGRWGRIRKSGGRLLIHTVLNVLLQMTGSLSMKYGKCFAENQLIKEGVALDESGYPMWVADVHDEWQMEVKTDEIKYLNYEVKKSDWKAEEKRQHIDDDGFIWSAPSVVNEGEDHFDVERTFHKAGHILADNMRRAGEFLRLRVPLAGEYKIGNSWHDTH